MSTHLTRRQEAIWRKKMIALEESLLRYYAMRINNPTTVDPADGSFCMSAFKAGYYLGRKKANKGACR